MYCIDNSQLNVEFIKFFMIKYIHISQLHSILCHKHWIHKMMKCILYLTFLFNMFLVSGILKFTRVIPIKKTEISPFLLAICQYHLYQSLFKFLNVVSKSNFITFSPKTDYSPKNIMVFVLSLTHQKLHKLWSKMYLFFITKLITSATFIYLCKAFDCITWITLVIV